MEIWPTLNEILKKARGVEHIRANLKADLERYAETIIEVPEAERWRYAIPSNYINYQNGFIVQDGEPYWVYLTYNEDRSVVTKYAQNVATGETCLYNEIFH